LDLLIILGLVAVASWGVVTAVVVAMILWYAISDARARRTTTRPVESSPGGSSSVPKSSLDADSEEVYSTRWQFATRTRRARSPVTARCRSAGIRHVPYEATEQSLN
jgi:hypothetical protein